MQISKVDHIRTAVIASSKDDVIDSMGVMYKIQSVEDDLDAYVNIRVNTARKQYSVLSIQKYQKYKGKKKSLYITIGGYLNSLLFYCLFFNRKEHIEYKKMYKRLIMAKKIRVDGKLQDMDKLISNYDIKIPQIDLSLCEELDTDFGEFVETTIDIGLRKSLRRRIQYGSKGQTISMPFLLKQILYSICSGGNYSHNIHKIDENKLEALCREIRKDYLGNKEYIVKSIKSNRTPVQVFCDKNGSKRLALSSSEDDSKKELFNTIKNYVVGFDEDKKTNVRVSDLILCRFRYLILIYYMADKIDKDYVSAISPWSFGQLRPDKKVIFSHEALDKLMLYNSKDDARYKNRQIMDSIKQDIYDRAIYNYNAAVERITLEAGDNTQNDIYWLKYIWKTTTQLILSEKNISEERLTVRYLCDAVFRRYTGYLAEKIIDMGKAVYHFVNFDYNVGAIGDILPEYSKGISSFDYERIKAYESLETDLVKYISFAVCNLSRAVCKEECFKDITNDTLKRADYNSDVNWRILQYFGGKSSWKSEIQSGDYDFLLDTDDKKKDNYILSTSLCDALRYLRNAYFHYSSTRGKRTSDEIIKKLIVAEKGRVSNYYSTMYYSNNVLMFYSPEKIYDLMYFLYTGNMDIPAQIPSFNKVIKKNELNIILNELLGKETMLRIENSEYKDYFLSCIYFLLKEVYYNGFLKEKGTSKSTLEYFKAANLKYNGKKEKMAVESFERHIGDMNKSLGEICQRVLSDYNLQNNMQKDKHKREKMGYSQFPLLIAKKIGIAFMNYLDDCKNTIIGFLMQPKLYTDMQGISSEQFTDRWGGYVKQKPDPLMWDEVINLLCDDGEMQAWYVAGHFMNHRYLNQLINTLKHYKQFTNDIEQRRSLFYKNKTDNGKLNSILEHNEKIINMLEFTMLFCEKISGKNGRDDYGDYFSEKEYNDLLLKFIDIGENPTLKSFCNEPTGIREFKTIGIYYNEGGDYILNRNIVKAKLYGNIGLLSKVMQDRKINIEDIRKYYDLYDRLKAYRDSGICKIKGKIDYENNDVFHLNQFRQYKNRIELTDLAIYTELVNDLMTRLITWAYYRERDLLYFQLGAQYINLQYGNIDTNDIRRKLISNTEISGEHVNVKIENNAVLYQLLATYSYHMPLFTKDTVLYDCMVSNKMKHFISMYGIEEYVRALNLFEGLSPRTVCIDGKNKEVDEHNLNIETRNYIDHFKYYASFDYSILDLYSQIFDRFFSYSMNKKKSVSINLINILAGYFVEAKLSFNWKRAVDNNGYLSSNTISIHKASSYEFIYKYIHNSNEEDISKKMNLCARSDEFVQTVCDILNYHR